jgi:alkyl sulfatase BDS1-like metallo-beta-lactamase superfamily hydrolase
MPKATITCDQLIKQAHLSILRHQTDFAKSLLERALAMEPDNVEARELLSTLVGTDAVTSPHDDGTPAAHWLAGEAAALIPDSKPSIAVADIAPESPAAVIPTPGTALLIAQAQQAIQQRRYRRAIELLQRVVDADRISSGDKAIGERQPANLIESVLANLKSAGPSALFYGALKLAACMLVGVLVVWVSVPNPNDTSVTVSIADLLGVSENLGIALGLVAGFLGFVAIEKLRRR